MEVRVIRSNEKRERAVRKAQRGSHGPNVRKLVQSKMVDPESPERNYLRAVRGDAFALLFRLKDCNSAARRAFRKECGRAGCEERAVDWLEVAGKRGERVPLAVEVRGPEPAVRSLCNSPLVESFGPVLDTPTFVHGSGSGDCESGNAAQAIQRYGKRSMMGKEEREARYQREERDNAAVNRAADVWLSTR